MVTAASSLASCPQILVFTQIAGSIYTLALRNYPPVSFTIEGDPRC